MPKTKICPPDLPIGLIGTKVTNIRVTTKRPSLFSTYKNSLREQKREGLERLTQQLYAAAKGLWCALHCGRDSVEALLSLIQKVYAAANPS